MENMYEHSVDNFLLYLNEAADQASYLPTNEIGDQLMIITPPQPQPQPPPPPPPAPAATKLHYQVPIFGGMLTDISLGDLQDFNNVMTSLQSNAIAIAAAMRKAKILRYKEKRKMRNFMKKIRYPSRKAYAEIRPRMRGRFVKVSETPSHPMSSTHESNSS